MNRNQLKTLAAFAMLLDHIALAFLPEQSAAYFTLRFLGRLTCPVMAFFVAEGYRHTRDVRRYALRLFLFALFSWIPFSIFLTGSFPVLLESGWIRRADYLCIYLPGWDMTLGIWLHFSVLHSLLLGLLAVWLLDTQRLSAGLRSLGILGLCVMAIPGDWSFYAVLFVLLFFCCRDRPTQKWLAYCLLCVCKLMEHGPIGFQIYGLGLFLVPPLLQFGFHDQPGRKTALSRWGFYCFYPIHLLILGLIR